MASYCLNDVGYAELERAIESYPGQFPSWTRKLDYISTQSGAPLRTVYRIIHKEQDKPAPIPVKLSSINSLFRFLLNDSTFDVSSQGYIHFKDEITKMTAQRSELKLIANCENLHFGSDVASQLDVLERWFNRNSSGFWVFKNREKIVISVVFVPINNLDNAKELFMRGEYTEGNIKIKHLYSLGDKSRVDSLYIESLAMHDVSLKARVQGLKLLCESLTEIIENSCNLDNLKYICVGCVSYGRKPIDERGI